MYSDTTTTAGMETYNALRFHALVDGRTFDKELVQQMYILVSPVLNNNMNTHVYVICKPVFHATLWKTTS
jgi:hypothetical protein